MNYSNYLHWAPDPVFFRVGEFAVHWYTFLMFAGVLVGERVITKLFKTYGLPTEHVGPMVIYAVGSAVVGAHLTHILFYEPSSIWNNPIRLLELGQGLASHGGAAGLVAGVWLFAKRYRVDFYRYLDFATFGLYFVIPFVRLGNFFNSEIYGRVTHVPWAVVFVNRGSTEPRHPSQLYEAALGVLFLAFCVWLERRYRYRLRPGLLTFLMPGVYCLTRFGVEFFKEYQSVAASFPLTMGQLLSLPVIALSAWMIWHRKLYTLLPEPTNPPTH